MSKPTAADKLAEIRANPQTLSWAEADKDRAELLSIIAARDKELEAYERDAAKSFIAKHQEKSGFKTGEIIANLTAENKRLRDAIDDAPHYDGCASGDAPWKCNCWKAALKEQDND